MRAVLVPDDAVQDVLRAVNTHQQVAPLPVDLAANTSAESRQRRRVRERVPDVTGPVLADIDHVLGGAGEDDRPEVVRLPTAGREEGRLGESDGVPLLVDGDDGAVE
jgi:hypothetical protein